MLGLGAVGCVLAAVSSQAFDRPAALGAASALRDDSVLLQQSLHLNSGSDSLSDSLSDSFGLELAQEGSNWDALVEGASATGRAIADDFCSFGAVEGYGCNPREKRRRQDVDSDPLVVPAPLGLNQQLRIFQDLALLEKPASNASTVSGGNASAVGAGAVARTVHRPKVGVETILLLCLYGAMYLLITGSILYYMSTETKDSTQDEQKKADCGIIEEDLVWRESAVRWFMNSWATRWTAKWGHSLDAAMTKIKPDELPRSLPVDKQPAKCSDHFWNIWLSEVENKGVSEARLFYVLVRFCGLPRLLYGSALYFLKTVAKDVYVVVLLELAVRTFRWIQAHNANISLEPLPLAPLIIAAVLFFSLHPLSIVFFTMLHSHVVRHIEQEVCGGLGVAMYRKGLRLPVCASAPGEEEQDQGKPQHRGPDLKQLIMNDACTNMLYSWNNLNQAIYCALQLAVMLVLLWRHIQTSVLLVVAGCCPVAMMLKWYGRHNGEAMRGIMYVEDYRNQRLQELFFGIRTVKYNAWETSMEEKMREIRAVHLEELRKLFGRQMVMGGLLIFSPKFLAILTLSSCLLIYGALDVSEIFVIIQIVNVIRGGTDGLTRCWADLVSASISMERIQTFLSLEEAPLCRKEMPSYLKLWPSMESQASTSLQLHGSFRWTPNSPAVLHELHLDVPRGSLVAVVGEVGCGKSTLLQAILGELYPERPVDSYLARPDRIAYCPQNPVIYEGTLRENVLFGQELQEPFYTKALDAASLSKDLEELPEGDGVMIGARGIVLSGGQRARVQLARAAYCSKAELMLLDDPFGSVDAPTGDHIFNKLLRGPLTESRTRIVALQPEKDRIVHFDHVVVMAGGRIVEQGKPEEVMASQHFQALLHKGSEASRSEPEAEDGGEALAADAEADVLGEAPVVENAEPGLEQLCSQHKAKLREEEAEGRPTWAHVQEYVSRGRFRNLLGLGLSLIAIEVCNLIGNLILARWANRQAVRGYSLGWFYVVGYVVCALVIVLCNYLVWLFVEFFSLTLSKALHEDVIRSLLQAPVDRFFDKQPVGRIMNRMTNDLRTIDRQLLFSGMTLFAILGQLCIPVGYVHSSMPFYFSLWVLPTYYIITTLWFRYWNTTVPIAYSTLVCLSSVTATIADTYEHSIIVRAYNDESRAINALSGTVSDYLRLTVSRNILEGWFMARLEVLWNFCTTFVVLFAIVNPGSIGVGTLGLCLTNMMFVQNIFTSLASGASSMMNEFISFVRLFEYLDIPQERPPYIEGDARYRNILVSFPRESMGSLVVTRESGVVRVCRTPEGGHPVVLLHASDDGEGLVPTKRPADVLRDLCPGCEELQAVTAWHHVACVNGVQGGAEALARELCSGSGEKVTLDVRSGWLKGGAQIRIQDLVVGYSDMPKEILRGINLSIEARQKVGIVGTTGCGKSTLLLALLRILEPRSGRILFNGIDTLNVGVRTLRSALGMVTQDPVLFAGTIRYNLDPYGTFNDEEILQVLEQVQLRALVDALPNKLAHNLAEGGENISYGQRKLACLARCVLRRPALLLLDEATSSIDPRTQEIINDVLCKDFSSATIISVAHRIETVEDYDLIVVLRDGRVVEKGPPSELAGRKGGIFACMLAARRRQLA